MLSLHYFWAVHAHGLSSQVLLQEKATTPFSAPRLGAHLGFSSQATVVVGKVEEKVLGVGCDLPAASRTKEAQTGGAETPQLGVVAALAAATEAEKKRWRENVTLVFCREGELIGEHLLKEDDIRQDLVLKWKKNCRSCLDLLSLEKHTQQVRNSLSVWSVNFSSI